MQEEPALQKDQDRKVAASLRKELFAANPDAGKAMAAHVAAAASSLGLESPKVISVFWPMGSEIDTRPLLQSLHTLGHITALPVVAAKAQPLIFRRWQTDDELVDGGFGTSVPVKDSPEAVPDVLFVPLLSYDNDGYRLGYGGGFYDRTLEKLRAENPDVMAIGVAFSGQRVETVARGPFDQALDGVATELGMVRFGAGKV